MSVESTDTLSEYFSSIEQSFDEMLAAKKKTDWLDTFGALSGLCFVLSLIPFIPFLLTRAVPWIAKSKLFLLRGHAIPLASIWFWWPTCVVTSLGLMVLFIRWESTRDKKNEKKWLSEPQIRFARCYSIVEEIARYRTNALPKHMNEASEHWRSLRGTLPRMLRPFSTGYRRAFESSQFDSTEDASWSKNQRFVFYPELEVIKKQFSWFQVDAKTESILEAFYTLPAKIQDRLFDKKDLEQVSSCLTAFAGYLYSRIPELPEHQRQPSIEHYGREQLRSFSEQLLKLPAYSSEPKETKRRVQFWKVASSAIQTATVPFAHPNIFACFLAWWAVTLLLTLVALRVVLHFFPNLTIDSILVSLIVGGPLACAATAVAISRGSKPGDSGPKGS